MVTVFSAVLCIRATLLPGLLHLPISPSFLLSQTPIIPTPPIYDTKSQGFPGSMTNTENKPSDTAGGEGTPKLNRCGLPDSDLLDAAHHFYQICQIGLMNEEMFPKCREGTSTGQDMIRRCVDPSPI